jgi:hypothetical protein
VKNDICEQIKELYTAIRPSPKFASSERIVHKYKLLAGFCVEKEK